MKKPPDLRINLELDPLRKTDEGFETTATAVVSRGQRAIFGELVMFFRNAVQVGGILQTDPNGRASQLIKIPADMKSVSVGVQIVGSSATMQKIVELTEEKGRGTTKVARGVYVTFAGEDGKQKLFISVSDENGNLIPNFPVSVIDGETSKPLKTPNEGVLVYEMNFTERNRYVEVRAGDEHDLIWRASLNGPAGRKENKT